MYENTDNEEKSKSFQNIIFDLQKFWADYGCVVAQPYDTEVGAGTSHYLTLLKAIGDEYWDVAYVQPSRRPGDGRYGENPNRTQYYYQYQVLLKPAPINPQEIYLDSLKAIGLDTTEHDMRFVEDDWENPSLGASGLGWEIWCDGMEITQYTYFQQVGGILCTVPPVEITYGLERITSFIQNVENHFDINWNGLSGNKKKTYGDVLKRFERESSFYNFEYANVDILLRHLRDYENECGNLLGNGLVIPAYEQCVKANHCFNVLCARGVVSVTERATYIARIRALAKACCSAWLEKDTEVVHEK